MANGHSLRMAAALLVLPAGPAPLLPTCVGGVWKAGVRLSGPSADPRALLAVVRGVLVDASGSRLSLRRPCLSRVLFPEPGRGGWSVAVHTRSRLVFARALLLRDLAVLLERSGLLIIEVPASELAAALPFPGVPPVLRLAACFVSRLACEILEKGGSRRKRVLPEWQEGSSSMGERPPLAAFSRRPRVL